MIKLKFLRVTSIIACFSLLAAIPVFAGTGDSFSGTVKVVVE